MGQVPKQLQFWVIEDFVSWWTSFLFVLVWIFVKLDSVTFKNSVQRMISSGMHIQSYELEKPKSAPCTVETIKQYHQGQDKKYDQFL